MKRTLLILVLALQSLWVLGTMARQEYVLRAGTVILLETQPVDPRDLLRGDYLILNYKISNLPAELFTSGTVHLKPGANVYVALEPQGQFYAAVQARAEFFTPAPGQVLMVGRYEPGWRSGVFHVVYGLERYYVPEGKGNPAGHLTVQVAVPVSGQASIKQVLVDGRPFAEASQR